jgi:Asp-tRNA(Asn)/Glu-tRNA(Gln) amidotransferase A subunit family amidase
MILPHAAGANGLPIGVQLSGPPLQEGLLIAVATAVESVIG